MDIQPFRIFVNIKNFKIFKGSVHLVSITVFHSYLLNENLETGPNWIITLIWSYLQNVQIQILFLKIHRPQS